MCRALEALHQASGPEGPLHVIHRDVTPGNVLVSVRGEVRLGDFGIAKARARALRTERGTIKGTLAYLSPEQARGDEVDERSDLYGLGLVLFELATGERFLSSPTESTLLAAAERPPWRAPSSVRPEASLFDAVLARALAVEPVRRFASAQQFRSALEALPPAGDASPRVAELVASVRDSALVPRRPLAPAGKLPPRPEVDVPRQRAPTERLQARSRRSAAWPILVAALAVAASVWLWAWWPTVAVRPRTGLDSVRVDADAPPPPPPPPPAPPAPPPASHATRRARARSRPRLAAAPAAPQGERVRSNDRGDEPRGGSVAAAVTLRDTAGRPRPAVDGSRAAAGGRRRPLHREARVRHLGGQRNRVGGAGGCPSPARRGFRH